MAKINTTNRRQFADTYITYATALRGEEGGATAQAKKILASTAPIVPKVSQNSNVIFKPKERVKDSR